MSTRILVILALLGVLPVSGVAAQEATPSPTSPSPSAGPTPTPACGGKLVPPHVVYKVEAKYPATLRKQGVQGVVVLEGVITMEGSVEEIKVRKSVSNDLNKLAIEAFRQWRYTPAMCGGKPFQVYITTTMTFSLH